MVIVIYISQKQSAVYLNSRTEQSQTRRDASPSKDVKLKEVSVPVEIGSLIVMDKVMKY